MNARIYACSCLTGGTAHVEPTLCRKAQNLACHYEMAVEHVAALDELAREGSISRLYRMRAHLTAEAYRAALEEHYLQQESTRSYVDLPVPLPHGDGTQ